MLKAIILFLIRLKLGVRNEQIFQFLNQKDDANYFFVSQGLVKSIPVGYEQYPNVNTYYWSGVSLHWLLSDECKIRKRMSDGTWV